jgi:hypothetical protein
MELLIAVRLLSAGTPPATAGADTTATTAAPQS